MSESSEVGAGTAPAQARSRGVASVIPVIPVVPVVLATRRSA